MELSSYQFLIIGNVLAMFGVLGWVALLAKRSEKFELIYLFYTVYLVVFCGLIPFLNSSEVMHSLIASLGRFDFRNGLHVGVLAFSMLFGCLPFIGLIKAKAPPLSGHEIVFVGIFVVMNPAMEEVLWRGYLYYYFFPNPRWGQLLAMGFVSSLLISLFHYFVLGNISRHFRNRSSFITIFVGSSFFCVFYALTGSVLPSLVSHILIGVVGGTTLVRNHNFLHARQADEGTLSYSAG